MMELCIDELRKICIIDNIEITLHAASVWSNEVFYLRISLNVSKVEKL